MAVPRVLLSWHESPRYIPAPVFSPDQFTTGPRRSDEPPDVYPLVTPNGHYDLHEQLCRAGIDPRFDLVMVSADAVQRNLPVNLAAFGCPLVLLAGDTHHLEKPLRAVVSYACSEPFDLVVSCHNRHHLHWFANAGLSRVAWLPGGIVQHVPAPPGSARRPCVAFVGQRSGFHPRRIRLLDRIGQSGLPLRALSVSREASAAVYARAQLCFNASLNSDLNMRVFEVLSAGGCLLTDRLAPASGLPLLLEEGREYLAYGDPDDMVEVARAALADPGRCAAIAASGHRRFMAELHPDLQRRRLMSWIAGAMVEPVYAVCDDPRLAGSSPPADLVRRMAVYERIQEAHRCIETPGVRITRDTSLSSMFDLADLPRLVMRVAPDAQAALAAAPAVRALGASVIAAAPGASFA